MELGGRVVCGLFILIGLGFGLYSCIMVVWCNFDDSNCDWFDCVFNGFDISICYLGGIIW